MSRAADRMGQLIDDLLSLSRVSRSELHQRERVDLSEIASNLAHELQAQEPDRKIAVEIEPGLTASADPRLIRIAFENLFGNAWKFTLERITIGVILHGGPHSRPHG